MRRRSITLKLPSPHPKQDDFINSTSRFNVGACGTKWGKTRGLTIKVAHDLWSKKNWIMWWVAPFNAQTMMAQRIIKRILPGKYIRTNAQQKFIEGPQGTRCYFKSAENIDALVGEGVNRLILDECARIAKAAWENVRTTITQTRGDAWLVSTPRGRNWFYSTWCKGMPVLNGIPNPNYDPSFKSFNLPTADNPFVAPSEVAQAQKDLPEDLFREFYLAEFLEDGAGVFKNPFARMIGELREWEPGDNLVMGVDFAKQRDFTVISLMDIHTKQVVFMQRFRKIDWPEQINIIDKLARDNFVKDIWVDSTGVGSSVLSFARRQITHASIHGYDITTNEKKRQLIMNLQHFFDQEVITLPRDLRWLREEFDHFEYSVSNTGKLLYSAASGYHDDGIMSLCLSAWGCKGQHIIREPSFAPVSHGFESPSTFSKRIQEERFRQLNQQLEEAKKAVLDVQYGD